MLHVPQVFNLLMVIRTTFFFISVRKLRGKKRTSSRKKLNPFRKPSRSGSSRQRFSKGTWARTSNKGVPVFTPAPAKTTTEAPVAEEEPVQPLTAFKTLSSRSRRRLVVDTSKAKVLGENLVNDFKPAFATTAERRAVAAITSEYNVGILVGLDYATYER